MLATGPWQWAVAVGGLLSILFLALLGAAFGIAGLGWSPVAGGLVLLVAFAVFLPLIPIFMNLSRSFFPWLFVLMVAHIVSTLFSYAMHYARIGISDGTATIQSFGEALYFSITTWTTLGYGDFAPAASARVAASMEALTGIVTIPLMAAMLWLWCSENMLPKEYAVFDGTYRLRGSLSTCRMRVRTILGNKKDLGDKWVEPCAPGDRMIYNDVTESWEKIEDDEALSEGTRVLEKDA